MLQATSKLLAAWRGRRGCYGTITLLVLLLLIVVLALLLATTALHYLVLLVLLLLRLATAATLELEARSYYISCMQYYYY